MLLLSLLVVNSIIKRSFPVDVHSFNLTIRFSRPRIFETPAGGFQGFTNDPDSFLNTARSVYFDVCDSRLDDYNSLVYFWSIWPLNYSHSSPLLVNSTDCDLHWKAPFEGFYELAVLVRVNVTPIASGKLKFPIHDLWIVAVGDSYASGQGNPDVSAQLMGIIPAQWISRDCYRSGYGSWAYQTYKIAERQYKHRGILFTYLACSGASIWKGILRPGFPQSVSQLDVVERIQREANRNLCACEGCCQKPIKPDVILMSVGGNDIHYSDVLFSILWGESLPVFEQIPKHFQNLEHDLKLLALEIDKKLGTLRPGTVFYPHYYDMMRNERGIIDASCDAVYTATTEEFVKANEEILLRINGLISSTANRFNWTAVEGVTDIFKRHGICSNFSYIRKVEESLALQGNCYGAFHPTQRAHKKIASLTWGKVWAHLSSYGII